MSVQATRNLSLTVNETIETNVPALSSQASVIHDGFNEVDTLSASTTPPATKVAAFTKALSAGAATIDLTALTGTNGASVTFSGLKVQAVKIINPSTNAGTLTVTPGASNGYNIFGASSSVTLSPGESCLFKFNETRPDVDGTHKTIDLAGTGTESSKWLLVAG